ncbi:MAG: HAD hydrolase-like protein [Fimbriimonadaceae bacterium]|nr:HAD hydrolase-like protein [Fimbriimonadaceae bacterium]
MLQLAVFDLAGTTIRDDNAVLRCLVEAIEAAGYVADRDALNARMGIPKPVAIAQTLPDVPEGLRTAIHSDFRERMIRHYETSPEVGAFDGVEELFAELRARGTRVALDTGFDRETIDVLLMRLGWQAAVDDSIGSDEVSHGRPAPDMVLALMRQFGITDAATVAKVGDTPSDIGEGRAAGCGAVIAVTYGTHTEAQLRAHGPTHIVDTVAALRDVLLSL